MDDFARARIEEARAALAARKLAKLGALIPAAQAALGPGSIRAL